MLPRLSANQFTHTLACYTVRIGKGLMAYAAGCVARANGEYLTRRQLGGAAPFAFGRPVLRRRIAHVVEGCSEEQVIRPRARRVVACVQHVKVIRDRAEVEFPRYTVRQEAAVRLVAAHAPVAVRVAVRGPLPASFAATDVASPAFSERLALSALPLPVARSRTESVGVGSVLRRDHQASVALLTDTRTIIRVHRGPFSFGVVPQAVLAVLGLSLVHSTPHRSM
jgi:hypothetical protein